MEAEYADGNQQPQRSVLSEDANEEGKEMVDAEPTGTELRKHEKGPVGNVDKEKHMRVKQVCFGKVNCDPIQTPIEKGANKSKVTGWTDVVTKKKKKLY